MSELSEQKTETENDDYLEQSSTSSDGEFQVIDRVPTEQALAVLDAPIFAPYDAEKFHDEARKQIANYLLLLLAGVIALFMCSLFTLAEKPTFDQYKSVLEMLLTPILTLVSAATGFYFGSKK